MRGCTLLDPHAWMFVDEICSRPTWIVFGAGRRRVTGRQPYFFSLGGAVCLEVGLVAF